MTVPQPLSHSRPMTAAEWAMLFALSLFWGGSFFFNVIALRDLPVLTVVASRVILAALILLAILRLRGQHLPRSAQIWAAFLVMGLLNNVIPFSLIVAGQQHIASGVASILNATTPLFGVLLAHVLTRDERMTGRRLAGVVIGFLGVAAMIGGDALRDLGTGVVAQLMCVGAAVSYAFASIFGRRFKQMGVTPMMTATGQVTASGLILLPVALIVDRPWTLPVPGLDTIAAVFGLAAIATALAYVLYFRILATAGATNILLVTLLVPVSAIMLGVLFLDEVLQTRHLLGMAMIAIGLAAIDGRLLDRLSGAGQWGQKKTGP